MGSKRPSRREFLKSGAAFAGGFTLGAVAPAIGQTPASGQHHRPSDDQGRQGPDRLRRPLQLRHLGAHRPSRGRQAFARSIRADVSMWRRRSRIRWG